MAKIEPITIEEARKVIEEARKVALPLSPEEEKHVQDILRKSEELHKKLNLDKLTVKRDWPPEVETLVDEIEELTLYLHCKKRAITEKAKEETGGKPILRNTTILEDPERRKRFDYDGLLDENPWFWEIDESWPPRRKAHAKLLRATFEENLILTPEQYERKLLYDSYWYLLRKVKERLIYPFDPSSRDFYEQASESVTIFF